MERTIITPTHEYVINSKDGYEFCADPNVKIIPLVIFPEDMSYERYVFWEFDPSTANVEGLEKNIKTLINDLVCKLGKPGKYYLYDCLHYVTVQSYISDGQHCQRFIQ